MPLPIGISASLVSLPSQCRNDVSRVSPSVPSGTPPAAKRRVLTPVSRIAYHRIASARISTRHEGHATRRVWGGPELEKRVRNEREMSGKDGK